MDEDPFKDINEVRLSAILKRHRIKETTWEAIKQEYLNWTPPFNPKLIQDIPDEQFIILSNRFFNFKRSLTIGTRKAEFNKWLKEYWWMFCSDTFEELCLKINQTLKRYNEENPRFAVPFINWIPSYGGILYDPAQCTDDLDIIYDVKPDELAHLD
jgi:hypothetical protein